MNARTLAENGVMLHHLQGAGQEGGGRELLKAVRLILEREEKRMKASPKLSDSNFKEDVKYRFGFIAALEEVLALPEAAGEYLKSKS